MKVLSTKNIRGVNLTDLENKFEETNFDSTFKFQLTNLNK